MALPFSIIIESPIPEMEFNCLILLDIKPLSQQPSHFLHKTDNSPVDTTGQFQLLVDTDTGPVPVTTMFGIMRKWEEEAKARLEAFLADSSIESMTVKEPKTGGMVASVVLIGTGLCMLITRLLI